MHTHIRENTQTRQDLSKSEQTRENCGQKEKNVKCEYMITDRKIQNKQI